MLFSGLGSSGRVPHGSRTRRSFGELAAASVVLALLASVVVAGPAFSDPTAVLDISQAVDHPAVGPGGSFTYSITVDCSSAECTNATLTDVLPAQFDALTLSSTVAVTPPPEAGVGYTTSWGGPNNRTLTVHFSDSSGNSGIAAGDGYTIQITMSVPSALSPDFGSNGVAVPNPASISADDADTKTSSTNVTVTVPVTVHTAITKSWTPSTTQYKVGEASVVDLTSQNTSNALATSLVLQDPANPSATSNPFEDVDFTSFGALTLPAGADQVFVDAYVAGAWVNGTVAETPSTLALPATVSPGQVDGLRFTFSSSTGQSTLTSNGSAGDVKLNLAQRAVTRSTSAALVLGNTASDTASSTVTVPGQAPVTSSATATYAVAGLNSIVGAAKSFSPARIPAGGSSVALISASNKSNGPLSTLTVAEPGTGTFFTPKVGFGGFSATSSWPTGATGASIAWQVNTGTVPAPSSFDSTGMPATPTLDSGQYITGFVITYSGSIAAAAVAGVAFTVNVAADENTDATTPVTLTNDAQVDGTNDAGSATSANATANLTVLAPQISLIETKKVIPSAAIVAGARSTVQLSTTTSSDTGYVVPNTIVFTDQQTGNANDYWNAFNAVAISPTQVPLGSTLTISYTTDGMTWIDVQSAAHTLPTVDATSSAQLYTGALPNAATIVGLRFTFTDPNGYAMSSILSPNVTFQARATLRIGGAPTAMVLSSPVTYVNDTTAAGVGHVTLDGVDQEVDGSSSATANALIKALPSGDNGTFLGKAWQPVSGVTDVSSQSVESRVARISWGTQVDGVAGVSIADPVDATAPVASTVFQAFNLTAIHGINPTATADPTVVVDPMIAYDEVTSVQLYNGSSWTPVSTCTLATPCVGSFPGYTLTTAEQGTTVGVIVTIAPADSTRTTMNATNPPPAVGSGVTSSPTSRPLDLVFQLRNQLRNPAAANTPTSPWVTATDTYNTADAGVVSNTAQGVYTPFTGSPSSDSAADTINIIDTPPAVKTTKLSSKTSIPIPNPGDVPTASYPTATFTLTATNTSAAQAWDLVQTDPMPCAQGSLSTCANNDAGPVKGYTVNPYASASYDPTTNPFEDFTITKIAPTLSTNSGISLPQSVVTLWHYNATTGVTSTTTVAGNSATLTNASLLADVVGVSIRYESTSTTNGGTIASNAVATTTLTVQLRQATRSTSAQTTPTNVAPTTVLNNSFAQIYDDVLPDANVYDSASASVALITGVVDVTATKTFTPNSLLEANRNTDVTVKLSATSGVSTASSDRVVIDDETPGFWNTFSLKSLGAITAPVGSDLVEIDAEVNGGSTWVTQTPVALASAALPATVSAANVTGIRFIFTKTGGALFSNTAPAAAWNASATLTVNVRAAYRDTGSPVLFPSTVSNTVTNTSTHPVFGTATASVPVTFTLNTGTFSVDVVKTPSTPTTPAGQFVNWTMTFTNTGTGYLNNPTILDQLPVDASLSTGSPLLFDPTAVPTYTDSSGGLLSTTTVTQAYNASTRQILYSWPAGSRLAPGEAYTIVVSLQVAPGLPSTYGNVINKFTFSSDQTLATCTNTTGTQLAIKSGKTCLTSNFVMVLSASAITTFKGVKGNVDSSGNSTSGATNTTNAATPCVSDSDGFYRTPCAANSVIGGTDLWKLQVVNGGNIPATASTIADVLPHSGDTLLRTSTSRGSNFTPVFAGNVTLITDSLSAGTVMTWQVATAANPCPNYDANPTCTTATWLDGPSYPTSNYASVTAIRVIFDFSHLAGGTLPPAAGLKITYETTNTPSVSSTDHRAPTTVPATGAFAWNTFGTYAEFGTSAPRTVEPVKAGIELETGSIQVNKVITGASAAYAPVSYTVNATCTIDGAPVTLPGGGAMTLNSSSTVPYSTRMDGLPVGSVCDLVEAASGASSVTYSPANTANTAAEVTVTTPGTSVTPVPAAQQATVTNSYGTTSLTVTKKVSTTTTVGSFGPFSFSLTCTVNNGLSLLPVTFPDGGTTMTFSLNANESNQIDNLPVNAVCALRETDAGNATSISASVDGAAATAAVQGGAITVALPAGSNHTAVVTNTFAGGQLAITKTVSDAGGITYGSGPFSVSVVCAYAGQTLYDTTASDPAISIVGGQTITLTPVFPVGTSCAVTETDAGGATSSAGSGAVLIVGPTGRQTVGLVTTTITNTFAKGSLKITKIVNVAGDALDNYGVGPFEATVTCTWVKDGSTLTIPLPNGGIVDLTSANSYTATITALIAGATCDVTESETGGATTSVVSAVTPATIAAGGTSNVTITNTFKTGSLTIDKDRLGTADAVSRFGQGSYTVSVVCSYLSNGAIVPIDLGAEATLVLNSADGYSAEVDGLLDGARCTVNETDAGLASSSALVPSNGTVTIQDSTSLNPAVVDVLNTFVVGALQIDKTASTTLTEGSASYSYTLAVSNTGTISAPGVTVSDPIDSNLKVTSIDSTGWASCAVTGSDVNGYGGTLDCDLGVDLGAASVAPVLTLNVTVLDTIAQNDIDNTATVCSTSPIFDCSTGTVSVPVKWIDVTATAVCVKDAPYLQYSVNAHNLDVSNHTLTVDWADKDGTFVHADSTPIATNGPVTGTLLWPGAAVDSSGNGTAWPGYRLALPGETPDWNGQVLDPTLATYGLRDHPLITFSINPHRTVTVAYPAASVDCTSVQPTNIAVTKTASVNVIHPGTPFTYTITSKDAGLGPVLNSVLTDPVPSSLRVTNIATVPAAAGMPDWVGCAMSGVNSDGGGGTVTCTLDRPLTYGQSAPNVILTTVTTANAPIGMITNTATMTGDPAAPSTDPTMSVDSSASVLDTKVLGLTGVVVAGNLLFGLAMLLLGLLFVGFGFVWTRLRRRTERA